MIFSEVRVLKYWMQCIFRGIALAAWEELNRGIALAAWEDLNWPWNSVHKWFHRFLRGHWPQQFRSYYWSCTTPCDWSSYESHNQNSCQTHLSRLTAATVGGAGKGSRWARPLMDSVCKNCASRFLNFLSGCTALDIKRQMSNVDEYEFFRIENALDGHR